MHKILAVVNILAKFQYYLVCHLIFVTELACILFFLLIRMAFWLTGLELFLMWLLWFIMYAAQINP